MVRIKKSIEVVSKMVDLLFGDGNITPTMDVMKRHPYLPFGN